MTRHDTKHLFSGNSLRVEKKNRVANGTALLQVCRSKKDFVVSRNGDMEFKQVPCNCVSKPNDRFAMFDRVAVRLT